MGFADHDYEGVEFVVVLGERLRLVAFQCFDREGLNLGVFCLFRQKLMPGDDAAEIFVDDHGWMAEGVEQDGVGGFGADSGERE